MRDGRTGGGAMTTVHGLAHEQSRVSECRYGPASDREARCNGGGAIMHYSRRTFLASGLALFPLAAAFAQSGHGHHGGLYERLQQPGRIDKPEVASSQNVFDSPAPKAENPGRWMPKAPLPLPRSEMAWATEHAGRMHLVGGYGEQRVDRPYHHVYDPRAIAGRWPHRCHAAPITSASSPWT